VFLGNPVVTVQVAISEEGALWRTLLLGGEGGARGGRDHGGPHWLCFAQGSVVEQVLGLAVCVVPHGFGGDRELVSILMLYKDVVYFYTSAEIY